MLFRRNIILIFLILACCAGLSFTKTPEELILLYIQNHYANLYVNNEKSKREVIEDLRLYLEKNKLNDQNISEIKKKLHKVGDGHLVLYDDRQEKSGRFSNGLIFIPGTQYLESCETCAPSLPKDRWQILEVNNESYQHYLDRHKFEVAASTPWGREHRLAHLLNENSNREDLILKLKSSKGMTVVVRPIWEILPVKASVCVSGERIDSETFKIVISSLWCSDPTSNKGKRSDIYENFKYQFDHVIENVGTNDKIILDLRENGGGGDNEVEYVLNTFFSRPVFMYHYKYLRTTHPGPKKWLAKVWPFKLALWSSDEYQFTDIKHRPKKQFFKNKLVTLISPGCFSSCETIASVLKQTKRSKLFGSRTHGGSGEPVIFPIFGTPYSLNIPACINWQENGEVYEGIGITPDQEVVPRPESQMDDVLKIAIDQVQ